MTKKNILITGADGGLGSQLVKLFSEINANLFLLSNNSKGLKKLLYKINAKSLENFNLINVDLSDHEALSIEMDRLSKSVEMDIIINNAGILIPDKLGEIKLDDWKKVLDVNLTAPFIIINKFVKNMLHNKNNNPLVVNISSISGYYGSPFCASYVASKFGLRGLSYAINEEYRINGNIRCINIAPGSINTDAVKKLNGYPGIAPKKGIDAILEPEDVADVIFELLKKSDVLNVEEIKIYPKKNKIYN